MTTVLENTLDNPSNEDKDILPTTLVKTKSILNNEDEKYTTNIDTLTRKKDSFSIEIFSKLLQLIRDLHQDDILSHSSLIETEYFHLRTLLDTLAGFSNSTLLQLEQKKKLNEFYGKINQQWELIYKASRDGYTANEFHSRCDNQGPTITIIQSSNNYLFGGYTSIPWTSENSYRNDTTAFLFTLTNPHNIPPTKYLINPLNIANAVYHKNDRGPTFGEGYDLYLANGSNSNKSSYTNFPTSYIDTTGKGDNTFTGAENFTVADIEVFKLL